MGEGVGGKVGGSLWDLGKEAEGIEEGVGWIWEAEGIGGSRRDLARGRRRDWEFEWDAGRAKSGAGGQ